VRPLRSLLALMLIQLSTATASLAAESINNPDSSTIYLLQCKFSRTAPAFEAMAQTDGNVKAADEFHKADLIKRVSASLRDKFTGLEGVNEVTVSLANHFSEYDAQNNEYDFDIGDSTYVPVHAFGHELRIDLTNGTNAQAWKLAPKEAEEVLRKNKGARFVRLVLRLALQPSPPATEGEPIVLNAKIVSYDVLNSLNNVKLGNAVVENAH
jgi:hypothetical protein